MLQLEMAHFRDFWLTSATRRDMKRDMSNWPPPRFMTDAELRRYFGLSARSLARLRLTGHFPGKDPLIGKTDRKAVDWFFDRRAGLDRAQIPSAVDGPENFGNCLSARR
jgi:hypothetical protein